MTTAAKLIMHLVPAGSIALCTVRVRAAVPVPDAEAEAVKVDTPQPMVCGLASFCTLKNGRVKIIVSEPLVPSKGVFNSNKYENCEGAAVTGSMIISLFLRKEVSTIPVEYGIDTLGAMSVARARVAPTFRPLSFSDCVTELVVTPVLTNTAHCVYAFSLLV